MEDSRNSPRTVDVVTGGAGFIGSHIVDRLLEMPEKCVRVLDNFSRGSRDNLAHQDGNPRLEIIDCDIADEKALAGRLDGADRVFHVAALADIVPSITSPDAYFHSNVVGTFNVVQQSVKARVKRLIYAASSSCYGIPDTYPTPESAVIRAEYPYALTKYLGEQVVLHWSKVYGLPALSLRLFNVYGPRARTAGTYGAVMGVFLAQLKAKKPVTIVGDGEQTRDFTFVSDVIEAFMAAAESERVGQIYNVGSGGSYSITKLVTLLGATERTYLPKRPGEPDCTFADTTRIQRDLGWRPIIPFDQGVRIMLDNIDHWKNAPVWTPEKISEATRDWFKYLGASEARASERNR